MQVKICGLTRRGDAELAAALGATHLGCVLAHDSPRGVTVEQAALVLRDHPPDLRSVLVFRGNPVREILDAAQEIGADAVQLHRYSAHDHEQLEAAGLNVMPVLEIGDRLPCFTATASQPVVLDVGAGGSGRNFDWSLLQPRAPEFAFVAGGITPDNIGRLLPAQPFGIDCSSGIESDTPGHKDGRRLRALFEAINP